MVSRRTYVKTVSGVGITGIAGCAGNGGNSNSNGDSNSSGDSNSNSDDAADVNFTIAGAFESSHITVEAAKMFAEKIEAMSDGSFTAEVVGGGAYGGEDEINEQVTTGTLAGHCGGSANVFAHIPEYAFFDTPWVLRNFDQQLEILNSDEYQPALEKLKQEGNQRQMGDRIYMGASTITANQEVTEVEDIPELNLRLPELDDWITTWEPLGANITPVSLDELYSAVQQNVVNATTGGGEQIASFNLQEVQDYLMLSSQRVATGHISLREDFYQDLDETYQDIADEAAQEATDEANEQALSREQSLIDDLSEEMTVIETEEIDTGSMYEEARPAVSQLFEEKWEGDLEMWGLD